MIKLQKDLEAANQKKQDSVAMRQAELKDQAEQNSAFMKLLYSDAKEIVLPNYRPFKASNGPMQAEDRTIEELQSRIRQTSASISMWLGDQAKEHDTAPGAVKKLWPLDCIEQVKAQLDSLIATVEETEAKAHVDVATMPEYAKAMGYRYWLAVESEKAIARREKELQKRQAIAERKAASDAAKAEAEKQQAAARKKAAKVHAEAVAAREAKLQAEIEARRQARQ